MGNFFTNLADVDWLKVERQAELLLVEPVAGGKTLDETHGAIGGKLDTLQAFATRFGRGKRFVLEGGGQMSNNRQGRFEFVCGRHQALHVVF